MTLLRSPDGSWTGEVVRPVDVVNLKSRGYTEVDADPEPAPVPEPEGLVVRVVELVESVTSDDLDEPAKPAKGKA